MNTKVTLLLLLVLLIILMLFYYIDLESNIIILLGVVIVLIIHNLITKKEHFNINEQSARLEAQIDSLTAVAEALRARSSSSGGGSNTQEPITISRSCPFKANTTGGNSSGVTAVSDLGDGQVQGLKLSTEFGTSINQLSAANLNAIGLINTPSDGTP
jgi:hypothetical protein